MNNRIEDWEKEFDKEFVHFPAEDVEPSILDPYGNVEPIKNFIRTLLTTIAEEAHKKGFQLGVIGSQTGDFKTEDAIEQIREEARREERERIQKSFDHWFKKGTEDVEDWAERELTTTKGDSTTGRP